MRRAAVIALTLVTALGLVGAALGAHALQRSGGPPAPTILASPIQPTASTRAVFGFTGMTGATFDCRVDRRDWRRCSSPYVIRGLPTGKHVFEVRARNADDIGQTARVFWTIDPAAPARPVISGAPLLPTSATTAIFTFQIPARATGQCRFDGGAWNRCSSPVTLSGLLPGPHAFDVRARSAKGATGPAASFLWTIGSGLSNARPRVLPTPAIIASPLEQTKSRQATFAFTTRHGLGLACQLDGHAFLTCTSPVTVAGLALGAHSFRVRSTKNGRHGQANTRRWRIVSPVPSRPAITTVPVQPTTSSTAVFGFVARTARSFRCALDGATPTLCRSPWTHTGLVPGSHLFQVWSVNAAGARSGATSHRWLIDTSLELGVTFLSTPPVTGADSTATFSWTGPEGAAYECSLDGAQFSPCSSPITFIGLAPGTHVFTVRIVGSGEAGSPATHAWSIEGSGGGGAAPSPLAFTITGDVPGVLSPGASAQLPLTISNPNTEAIVVSNLVVTVSAGSSKPGCDGATNLTVIQSNAATSETVTVPAQSSVTLPAATATAPIVAMPDLPVNQNACKNAVFTLTYAATGMQAP